VPASSLPLVTVVTPSYNQGRFIRATIESVLSQGYPNLEYIIMDGASTDETAEVAAEYAERLTFISEKDRGQSHAINKGFAMARGEFVAWLNSDDIFLPGAVERAVAALREHPEAGAVYGDGYQIDLDGNVISKFAVTQKFDLWKLLYLSDYILQQTVFFRRSVFDTVGWIDESLHYGMDWDILMRIGLECGIVYIPADMGAIREYATAKTAAGGTKRVHELVTIMRRHTGHPFPPGAIAYGLPTYEKLWNQRIEALFPESMPRVKRKLQSYVARVAYWIVGQTLRYAQGLFSDGWASTRARFVFPPARARNLEMTVSLPGWAPIERQTITFRANGKVFARESFERGEFTIPVALPRGLWSKPVHITVDAAKFFLTPVARDGRRDPRKLCYLLKDIEYAKPRGGPLG